MTTDNLESVSRYWLCPLYSFDCDYESVDLAEGIQITKIPSKFIEYLDRNYSHNLKTILSEAKWVASLPDKANTKGISKPEELASIGYQEWDRARDSLVDLITALRLYQKGRVVTGLLTLAKFENSEWSIGGETIWTSISSVDFFLEDPIYKFLQPDVPKVNDLLLNIRKWREAKILDKINITLGRFHSAYHGPIEDRIIDQMIAFESLYLGNEQELTYKLALRTAFLLGERKSQREAIFDDMKKAYNYRSRIVHGNNPPTRDKERVIVSKTEEYLRRSIRKFLLLLSQGHSLKEIRGKLLDENIMKNGKTLSFSE